jgi:hypothetical protein
LSVAVDGTTRDPLTIGFPPAPFLATGGHVTRKAASNPSKKGGNTRRQEEIPIVKGSDPKKGNNFVTIRTSGTSRRRGDFAGSRASY